MDGLMIALVVAALVIGGLLDAVYSIDLATPATIEHRNVPKSLAGDRAQSAKWAGG